MPPPPPPPHSATFLLLLITTLFTLSSSSHHPHITSHVATTELLPILQPTATTNTNPTNGEWALLQPSVGVSAMHMQLLHNNKIVIFDRTDFGPSNLPLPPSSPCRNNDEVVTPLDCTAHSLLYDIATNTFRPLSVQTDVWCSSAALSSDGTLIQTGGFHSGDHKIRMFSPCDDGNCDWVELPQNLTAQRWYASNQLLPDGRVIIVGGRRAFSYEFFPKTEQDNNTLFFYFDFLRNTTDPREENNLYPFLHLLPDSNLFIFANRRSILFNYVNGTIIKEFPIIPGEKRSYPATGSSVLLPLHGGDTTAEVMICGGANGGAYVKALRSIFVKASKSCGRLRVTDPDPKWEMQFMPMNRVMSDMLLLPTGQVLILNGAARGTAGWESAIDPVLNPVLYDPEDRRFTVLNPSRIARMYHSAATLMPDGRVLVGGSNPHRWYNFTGVRYPTELSLEAFSPPYMAQESSHLRPSILALEGDGMLSYGQDFSITFTLGMNEPTGEYMVTMLAPAFNTHSFGMNQRLLVLNVVEMHQLSASAYRVTVRAPQTSSIAPPGYYMVFVVHQGVPSHSVWVRVK